MGFWRGPDLVVVSNWRGSSGRAARTGSLRAEMAQARQRRTGKDELEASRLRNGTAKIAERNFGRRGVRTILTQAGTARARTGAF